MIQDFNEPSNEMSNEVKDIVRALSSLIEEIEAVSWYSQRVAVATNKEIADIMWHNAKEEMEHAMMTLEWLRRNQEGWHEQMSTYLFTEGPIMEIEEEGGSEKKSGFDKDLGIGNLE